MTQTVKRVLSASAAAVALTVAAGLGAPANGTDDFVQHARDCAQSMGFDGQMNPGMHQGRYGADPSMTC